MINFQQLYHQIWNFLAIYGWPITFTLIALYAFQDQIRNAYNKWNLADANRPGRKNVLDAERHRIRRLQEEKMQEETEKNK